MAWQTLKYQLTSDAALIQHNGQTADPLNKWAKALKQISSKRKKTDADYEEMARLEFFASLYMGQDGPVIPANVIESLLVKAAMKSNEGPVAKMACFCLEHASLRYDGPRTAQDLWEDERFRFSAIVRVQSSRVARMRPIFPEWAALLSFNIEDTLVNPARVDDWMYVAGTQIGIGDWRPRYGRFTAERLNGK